MSSLSPTCYENIIGLSRTPCPCVEDLTVEATTSASGLYLDELDGINLRFMDAGIDCGQGTLWEMGATAVSNAMEQTIGDLMTCLGKETETRRRSSNASQIGTDKKAGGSGVALNSTFHGMVLEPAKMKGGIFKVTHIAAAFKQAGDVTVYVYDEWSLVATYILTAVANVSTWYELPTPLELSMSSLGSSPAQYWFVYRPDEFTGDQPLKAMDTKYACGVCGGYTPTWSPTNPQYNSSNAKGGELWADWAQSTGVVGSDITERDSWAGRSNNQTQGIMLRVAFDCDKRSSFCADNPNYQTDEIQKAIAHAVRFKAGANLITRILASTAINRYTMTAGETLAALRTEFLYQYDGITKGVQGPDGKWLNGYVCAELSEPGSVNRYGDCLKCKDHWGARVSRIQG